MSIFQITLVVFGIVGFAGAVGVLARWISSADEARRRSEQTAFHEASLWLAREMEKNSELRRRNSGKE